MPRPSSTSSPRTPPHRKGKGLLGHNVDGETLPNYIGRNRGSIQPPLHGGMILQLLLQVEGEAYYQ